MIKTREVILAVIFSVVTLAPGFAGENGHQPLEAFPSPARAASSQASVVGFKTLVVMAGGPMSPLYITRVTMGNKEMILGTPMSAKQQAANPNLILNARPFEASSGWINDMTLFIKNRTNKTVASATIALRFPETGNGRTQPVWIYQLRLGRLPAVDAFDGRTGKPLAVDPSLKSIDLPPGQETIVNVGDYIDKIKAYVETAMPLYYVTKMAVSVQDCVFVDGTRYAGGSYSVPDPVHRGKWKYFPSDYFPGNPRQYWPPGF